MRRGNTDLLAAVLVAATSVVVVLVVPYGPVRTLFALPLLFVLPGLSLTAALFPRPLDPARRVLLQLGLSLSVAILGALLLDLTFGLRRSSWAVLLAGVTCVGAAVAARRRTSLAPGEWGIRRPRRLDVALMGIALAVVVGAVVLARTPLAARNVQGYTALSILPTRASRDGRGVRVQVSSAELRTVSYRLELLVAHRLVNLRYLTLVPGETWGERLRLASNQLAGSPWIRARLYRLEHPHTVYRSVRIRAGA